MNIGIDFVTRPLFHVSAVGLHVLASFLSRCLSVPADRPHTTVIPNSFPFCKCCYQSVFSVPCLSVPVKGQDKLTSDSECTERLLPCIVNALKDYFLV